MITSTKDETFFDFFARVKQFMFYYDKETVTTTWENIELVIHYHSKIEDTYQIFIEKCRGGALSDALDRFNKLFDQYVKLSKAQYEIAKETKEKLDKLTKQKTLSHLEQSSL